MSKSERAPEDDDGKAKLIAAWEAAARHLVEAGYSAPEVFQTMADVALAGAVELARAGRRSADDAPGK